MRLPRFFRGMVKHPDSDSRKTCECQPGAGGCIHAEDSVVHSGRTSRPASTLTASQVEFEVEPGLIFRSNPSMLIECKPGDKKQIFPLARDRDGAWRYALQGFGSFSYVDKHISQKIEESMHAYLNDLIVTFE